MTEAEGLKLHLSERAASGYKGVTCTFRRFSVTARGKHLGTFDTAVEAAVAFARYEEVGAVLDGVISQLPFEMTAAAEGLTLLRSDNSTGFKHGPSIRLARCDSNSALQSTVNPSVGRMETAEEAALAVARFLGPDRVALELSGRRASDLPRASLPAAKPPLAFELFTEHRRVAIDQQHPELSESARQALAVQDWLQPPTELVALKDRLLVSQVSAREAWERVHPPPGEACGIYGCTLRIHHSGPCIVPDAGGRRTRGEAAPRAPPPPPPPSRFALVMTAAEALAAAEAEGLTLQRNESQTGYYGITRSCYEKKPFKAIAGSGAPDPMLSLGHFVTAEQAALERARYLKSEHAAAAAAAKAAAKAAKAAATPPTAALVVAKPASFAELPPRVAVPPAPKEWVYPSVGDVIEVDVADDSGGPSTWQQARVENVVGSWFQARIGIGSASWTDWFTWQEEGVDWRRALPPKAPASQFADGHLRAGADGRSQWRVLGAIGSNGVSVWKRVDLAGAGTVAVTAAGSKRAAPAQLGAQAAALTDGVAPSRQGNRAGAVARVGRGRVPGGVPARRTHVGRKEAVPRSLARLRARTRLVGE